MKFYPIIMIILLATVSVSAQFDDLYYTPDTDDLYGETVAVSDYGYDDYGYDDYDDYEYLSDYDYYYTSRIRRFSRARRCGFNYFHPFYGYNGMLDPYNFYAGYHDPFFTYANYYNPYRYRPGITVVIGNRWRTNNWWAFNDPYGYYYNSIYGYNGWNTWNVYNNYYGWNNGWNNGCPSGNFGGNVYNTYNYNNGGGSSDVFYGSRGGGSTSTSSKGIKDNPRYVAPSPKERESNVYTAPTSVSTSKGRVLQTENGPVENTRTTTTPKQSYTRPDVQATPKEDTRTYSYPQKGAKSTQSDKTSRSYDSSSTPKSRSDSYDRGSKRVWDGAKDIMTRSNRSSSNSGSTSSSGSSSSRSSGSYNSSSRKSSSSNSRSYRPSSSSRSSSGYRSSSSRSSSTRSYSPSSSSRSSSGSYRSGSSSRSSSGSYRSSSSSSRSSGSSSRSSSSRSSSSRGGK